MTLTKQPRRIEIPRDFPDWLSPMIVKELRQGMRAKGFTVPFVLIHVPVIILTTATFAAQGAGVGFFEGGLWQLLGLVFTVLLPAMGFFTQAAETRERRAELLLLTRMRVRKIVFGKWLCLTVQSWLVALSLAPYLIARYMAGGVDLPSECLIFAMLLSANAVANAVVVGVSNYRNLFLRFWVLGLASYCSYLLAFATIITHHLLLDLVGAVASADNPWEILVANPWLMLHSLLCWFVCCGIVVFLSLRLAASKIVPQKGFDATDTSTGVLAGILLFAMPIGVGVFGVGSQGTGTLVLALLFLFLAYVMDDGTRVRESLKEMQ